MTPFRLDIAFPATNKTTASSKSFTAGDQVVQKIDVVLKKDKGRISTLTADLFDFNGSAVWDLFNDIPDIAFFDIPVKFYMGTPDQPSSLKALVFDGIATAYDANTPGPSTLQIVAHDYSHKARVKALSRSFKNKDSVGLAKAIAQAYGWTVDSSVGDVSLIQRTISIGIPGGGETHFTDWDHLVRELESDGLHCFMRGKTLYIRQMPTSQYSHTFRPGDGLLKHLNVRIQHVRGPGGLGNTSTPVAFDHSGTDRAARGNAATEAGKIQGGDGRTHRHPVGGPKSNSDAHSQDTSVTWQNGVTKFRGRKDEATMTCNPVPDLYLTHLVNLDGVGSKADGLWETVEIRHAIVPGDAGSGTDVSLARGTNKQAAGQSGAPAFEYAKS